MVLATEAKSGARFVQKGIRPHLLVKTNQQDWYRIDWRINPPGLAFRGVVGECDRSVGAASPATSCTGGSTSPSLAEG